MFLSLWNSNSILLGYFLIVINNAVGRMYRLDIGKAQGEIVICNME